jgi:hypothetical protein
MKSKIHQEILEDICGGCHNYCLLKEIMLNELSLDDRALEQMKCVEKFKFEQSERERRDIGWTEAWRAWVNEGYAKKFSEVYKSGMVHSEIWEAIFNHKEKIVLDPCIYLG